MVIDWKALFIAGRPLYESDGIELSNSVDLHSSFMTTACSVEGLKPPTTNDRVLNNIDFEDYNVSMYIAIMHLLYLHLETGCVSCS